MNPPIPPDPFKSAKRVPGVHVTLRPEDIMHVWGSISQDAAERLLDKHGPQIASEMLAAGIGAAARILSESGGGA